MKVFSLEKISTECECESDANKCGNEVLDEINPAIQNQMVVEHGFESLSDLDEYRDIVAHVDSLPDTTLKLLDVALESIKFNVGIDASDIVKGGVDDRKISLEGDIVETSAKIVYGIYKVTYKTVGWLKDFTLKLIIPMTHAKDKLTNCVKILSDTKHTGEVTEIDPEKHINAFNRYIVNIKPLYAMYKTNDVCEMIGKFSSDLKDITAILKSDMNDSDKELDGLFIDKDNNVPMKFGKYGKFGILFSYKHTRFNSFTFEPIKEGVLHEKIVEFGGHGNVKPISVSELYECSYKLLNVYNDFVTVVSNNKKLMDSLDRNAKLLKAELDKKETNTLTAKETLSKIRSKINFSTTVIPDVNKKVFKKCSSVIDVIDDIVSCLKINK